LVAADGKIQVGKPLVAGATVKAEVIGLTRGKKLVIFRFKRRKNVRRKTGHRQSYTKIRITDISA
jgi:large subunit ribosomal protein L21